MYETFSNKASQAAIAAYPQISIKDIYEVHTSTSDDVESPEKITFVINNANWQIISDLMNIIREIIPENVLIEIWHNANYSNSNV